MKRIFAGLLGLLLAMPASAQNYLRDDGIFHSVVEGTTNGQLLTNNGGVLGGISLPSLPLTIGTTPISGGTPVQVLYDNGGVLGEYAISGTGSVCMTVSCIMTTPNLGTPSAITLTNGLGLPIAGITGLGTGVGAALGINTGSAGAFITLGGTAGTPSSIILTNGGGLPIAGINGLGGSVAATLATNINVSGGIVSPTPTRAGDIIYWNGAAWVTLPGNNSGTMTLQENASGVPVWATVAGTGTVTSAVIAAGTGVTVSGTCTITTSGTCTIGSNVASVDNFLPNVQWQAWSGSSFALKQNAAGTTTQSWPSCTSFTTVTQGPVFTCANTQQVKVNDIVLVELPAGAVNFWGFAGAGYITCAQVNCQSSFPTAARVIAVTPNTSITLLSPGFAGVSPVASAATTLVPIAPGDLGAGGVTNGPDGWTKANTLVATIDDFGAAATPASTVYPGCIRPLMLRKGITGNEAFQWSAPTSQVSRYQGQTITFGIAVYQRVQGGANTWQTYISDNTGGASSVTGTGVSLGGYQFLTVTRTIAAAATFVNIGLQTEGNVGDIYAVCLPTAAFAPSMLQSQLKQNSGEVIRITSHWNPPLMTPYIINFPSSEICGGCGLYGYNGNDIEALSLGTVHNSVGNVYGKLEWTSSRVGAQVFVGGNVNITNGLTFGIQASTQVSGVTFPTSITRMPLYHDGTFAIYTGTSGLIPTNGTFDFTDVDTSPPTSVD